MTQVRVGGSGKAAVSRDVLHSRLSQSNIIEKQQKQTTLSSVQKMMRTHKICLGFLVWVIAVLIKWKTDVWNK